MIERNPPRQHVLTGLNMGVSNDQLKMIHALTEAYTQLDLKLRGAGIDAREVVKIALVDGFDYIVM